MAAPLAPASITYPETSNDGYYDVSWEASAGATSYTLQSRWFLHAAWSDWYEMYSGANLIFSEANDVNAGWEGALLEYRIMASNADGDSSWTTGDHDLLISAEAEPEPETSEESVVSEDANKIRLIPFIYSSDVAYVVRLGDQYLEFIYDDAIITTDGAAPLADHSTDYWIAAPYLAEHLFELQYKQVGDTMWITHPLYAPMKLIRTSPTTFSLTEIPFESGPFRVRNDLIDPVHPSSITLTPDNTGIPIGVGSYSITEYNIGAGRIERSAPNYIDKGIWWRSDASKGVDGDLTTYCGGGYRSDGKPVYITYTVTYDDPIAVLTDITIDYICMSHDQSADLTLNEHTQRGLRVYDSVAGTWTTIVSPDDPDATFPASTYAGNSIVTLGSSAAPCDEVTISGSWTNVTQIEVYLWADASSHSTAAAIFNISTGIQGALKGTLIASDNVFYSGMEGTLFKLTQPRINTSVAITVGQPGPSATDQASPALAIKGTFRLGSHGAWTGTFELQRNEDNSGWDTYRTYVGKNDRNIQEAFVEDSDNVKYRIYVHTGMTSSFSAELSMDNTLQDGVVRIISVDSPTEATYSVILPLASLAPTKRWAEGAWSPYRGFPTSVTFFEDRCIYAGMSDVPSLDPAVNGKLLTVWLSATSDYDNFEAGVKDADSFELAVTTTNDCRWLDSLESLVLGTGGDEWRIGTNRMEQPLSPTNFSVRQQSTFGSRWLQPIRANNVELFVDFVGRKVRELTFNGDKYVAPDLSAMAEHITVGGIADLALQRNPDCILWCVLDGDLVAMVYERDQNVVAWWKVPIEGTVLSVCRIPDVAEDKVYIAVFRIIAGETLTYEGEDLYYEDELLTDVQYSVFIELFAPRVFTAIEDAFFVDCGITFTSYTPTATVTGLDHLEGETVQVLGDGQWLDDAVVAGGQITVSLDSEVTTISKAQVGKKFKSKVQPMRLITGTPKGSSQGMTTRIYKTGISFLNTIDPQYGTSDDKLFNINWTDSQWEHDPEEMAGLFSGEVEVTVDGGYTVQNPLMIISEAPLPCIVRSMLPRLEVSSD